MLQICTVPPEFVGLFPGDAICSCNNIYNPLILGTDQDHRLQDLGIHNHT